MQLFNQSKNADVLETEQAVPFPNNKQIRLNFSVLSSLRALSGSATASDTLAWPGEHIFLSVVNPERAATAITKGFRQ